MPPCEEIDNWWHEWPASCYFNRMPAAIHTGILLHIRFQRAKHLIVHWRLVWEGAGQAADLLRKRPALSWRQQLHNVVTEMDAIT